MEPKLREITIQGLPELKQFVGSQILPQIQKKTVLLLSGELGSGKTQLVRYLVELLGGEGVASPTFSLINKYVTKKFDFYHMDFYRLNNLEDLESTGFWDLFETESVIAIEWADKFKLKFPKAFRCIEVNINIEGPFERSLRVKLLF